MSVNNNEWLGGFWIFSHSRERRQVRGWGLDNTGLGMGAGEILQEPPSGLIQSRNLGQETRGRRRHDTALHPLRRGRDTLPPSLFLGESTGCERKRTEGKLQSGIMQ